MRKITPEQADAAYTILVRHADALDRADERDEFVRRVAHSERPCILCWFVCKLGRIGTFWSAHTPYATYDPEHLTRERQTVIDATNAALAQLFADK